MSARFNLGQYEVLQALRSGGMGEVVLARRRGPGGFEQLCAVKTIRGELATAPAVRTMFLDEARLLARLTHPAIAQILDVGEDGGTLYMVIEYVPGVQFRRFGELRPPPAIVCAAMAQACRGLHAAHELRDVADDHLLGVVHRDISPDNLMLGFDGRVKVLDFGIALVRGRHAPVTELGVLKGKPPYMSPEQVKNQALDRRSDVFSACVVLHELLTGEPLFQGDSIYAVARAVAYDPILPPSTRAGPLPLELDQVVLAGLERDHDQRLASAGALAEVLERIAAQTATESLEAWVDRALAVERAEHRAWLATVVAATRQLSAVGVGRPTGTVTAIDAEAARVPTQLAPEVAPPPPDEPAVVGRRSRWRRRTAALLVLAVAAIAGWFVVVDGPARAPGVVAEAGTVDAPIVVDAAALVPGSVDADVDLDATSARDAGRRGPRDAGARSPVDAIVTARPFDAARAPIDAAAITADGFVTIHATPYADIELDGAPWGVTPVFKRRLRAGRHVVTLRSPDDGRVILRREIDVVPGKIVEVAP